MQDAGLILGPLLATNMSHDLIWRVRVAFGAVLALAVYWPRRHLKESPRYLAAMGQQEDPERQAEASGALGQGHAFAFVRGWISPAGE